MRTIWIALVAMVSFTSASLFANEAEVAAEPAAVEQTEQTTASVGEEEKTAEVASAETEESKN